MWFPGSASPKKSACQCWRPKRCGFNSWVGKIPRSPHPGTEPIPLMSPALAGGLFTSSTTWEAQNDSRCHNMKWTIQNTYFIPSVNFEYVESLLVVEKRKVHWAGRQRTKLPASLPLFNFSKFRYFIDKLVMIGERSLGKSSFSRNMGLNLLERLWTGLIKSHIW